MTNPLLDISLTNSGNEATTAAIRLLAAPDHTPSTRTSTANNHRPERSPHKRRSALARRASYADHQGRSAVRGCSQSNRGLECKLKKKNLSLLFPERPAFFISVRSFNAEIRLLVVPTVRFRGLLVLSPTALAAPTAFVKARNHWNTGKARIAIVAKARTVSSF